MKIIFVIAFLYLVFTSVYLSTKYSLIDNGQCGRCVSVCSVVCMDKSPCGFVQYVKTYFIAAYDGCRNLLK